MYIVICSLIFFSCCALVIWFSVPFLFYPRLSSPRQYLLLSLPFLSHLFASSLLPFSLPLSPARVSCLPSSICIVSLLSSLHASLLRVYRRLSSFLFYSVYPLISCISPLLLSSLPLCILLSLNMYICAYMHAHIHENAYIGSGRSMACKDRSSNR